MCGMSTPVLPENDLMAVSAPRPRWLHKVEAIDRQILDAKTRRNTLVPIASLPSEVLGDIFEYVAHAPFSWTYRTYNAISRSTAWPAIMLVCKCWRDVAVRHHALWTFLTDRNVQHWPLFLKRSHSQPVDIRLNTDSEEIDGPLSAALAQLPRIRSLDLRLQETVMERVLPLLNGASPKLESLHLTILYGVTARTAHYTGQITRTRTRRWITSLRQDFVSALAPNLREICLSGVCFPWGVCAGNLRNLTVECGMPPRDLPIVTPLAKTFTFSDVLRTLSTSPLEFLRLRDLSGSVSETAELGRPTTTLSTLKRVIISNSPANLPLAIWFSTPNLDYVDIKMDTLPDTFSMDQLEALVRHAGLHLSRHSSSSVKSLLVRYSASLTVESEEVKLSIPSPASFRVNPSAPASHILTMVPLEHLMKLELGDRIELTEQLLKTILPRLPRLTDLKLSAGAATIANILAMLVRPILEARKHGSIPGNEKDVSVRPPVLPLLKVLSLSHVDFTWKAGDTQLSLFMELVLATRGKSQPQLGPTSVEIRECDVTQEMIRSWSVGRKVDVIWDGLTGKCPSPLPPSPRGPMLWDSDNEEWYEAELLPDVWDLNKNVWDEDSD